MYTVYQKKYGVADYLYFKNGNIQQLIFSDIINTTFIQLCVKFQHETKRYEGGSNDESNLDLDDKTTNFKNKS